MPVMMMSLMHAVVLTFIRLPHTCDDGVTDGCSRGGVGRAGTIGACLLVYAFHVSAEDALDRVQRAYDTRGGSGRSNNPRSCVVRDPDRLHSRCRTINPIQNLRLTAHPCLQAGISPETDEQADFVREFQRALDDGTINRTAPTLSV
jgi:hypothetical protein